MQHKPWKIYVIDQEIDQMHLIGDRKGKCSIRIERQWRICFAWNNGNANEVEIVDYIFR